MDLGHTTWLTSPGGWLIASLVALVIWYGINPVLWYRYRHIPGPVGLPFLGNLLAVASKQQHIYYEELRKKYGPVFKIWLGSTPFVVIADAEAIRRLSYRLQDRYPLPNTQSGHEKYILDENLLIMRSERWRLVRKAWEPALMNPSSLAGYHPLMLQCAQELVAFLEGQAGQEGGVELTQEAGKFAMKSVATCGFGIHFNMGWGTESAATDDAWAATSKSVLEASYLFFRTTELDNGSAWVLPLLALPTWDPLWRRLAAALPDKGQRDTKQALATMREMGLHIMASCREQRLQQQGEAAANTTPDAAAGGGAAAGEGVAAKRGPKGLLPGSFAVHLEKWLHQQQELVEDGDELAVAQIITFLFAGYETSASVLAVLVYYLSISPEAEQKLIEEVDTALQGRAPTIFDIEKLDYTTACIEEAMRLLPPAAQTFRVNTGPPLDVLGYPLPTGAHIDLFQMGLNTDPEVWPESERFVPERHLQGASRRLGPLRDNIMLPFGAGPRMCAGYKFAQLELKTVVACLYQKLTFTQLPGAGPLQTRIGLTLRPKEVMVRVHKRQ